jgi:cytochrome P450
MLTIDSVAQAIIAKRFTDEKTNRHDMVISFKKAGLTRDEITDESLFQLLAGSDTTATVIRTGFLSIMTNPRVYAKLQAEISAADIPLSTVISTRQSLQLPYLQATIKEAQRHHPAAVGLLPRVVGPEGDTHNGVYFPPRTEIAYCAWNLHRKNTKVYGEDAALFRPERWLEASPERLAVMEESFHLVFGYGRNRCMGENIARLELNKVFFEMFRRFDWSVVDSVKPFEKNMSYGLFVQKGMWVRVSEKGA